MIDFAPTIDATGIHADDFATTLAKVYAVVRSIYGADFYIDPDGQDGQLLAIFAKGLSDCGAVAVAVFNAFSPQTAQGNGLSSVVKINGLARLIASASTCDVTLVGQAGVTITNGKIGPADGSTTWALPPSVTIPNAGTITVTATCQTLGAITAAPGTLTKIKTPVYGWQTVTNANAAVAGNPVETDAALRARQSQSVAAPSQTILDGVLASIAEDVAGVTRHAHYENATATADANGIPSKTVAIFVEGGDSNAIAQIIGVKLTPGVIMQGTTTVPYVSPKGSTKDVKFSRPTNAAIKVAITLKALTGWSTDVEPIIAKAVADYINTLDIGKTVSFFAMSDPARLPGSSYGQTYRVTAMTISKNAGAPGTADLALAYNEVPFGDPANVTFTVT